MKNYILLGCLLALPLHAKLDISSSFKAVKKQLNSIQKELAAYAKNNKPYEVRNLTTLIRTHINLMASGTTATAPQYASQELEIKKHLNDASKKLFSRIRDKAHELNPATKLFGGSTISLEAEAYLAGVIAILRSELESENARILRQAQDERSGGLFSARPEPVEGNKRKKLKKIHKEGLKYIKKNKKLLNEDDKKLLVHERGLIESYKKLHHAKAVKQSPIMVSGAEGVVSNHGPAASEKLTMEMNTAANREIELFNALSKDAQAIFRKIREYAQQINAQDTFMGGLSPKVIAFLDDVKKRL